MSERWWEDSDDPIVRLCHDGRDAHLSACLMLAVAEGWTRETTLLHMVTVVATAARDYREAYERLLRDGPAPVVIVRGET